MNSAKNISLCSLQTEKNKTWQWLVIVSTFFNRVTITSLTVSYSVVYFTLTERGDMTHTGASLIIGVFVAVNCFLSPVSTLLSLYHNPQKLVFIGILLISAGLALCSISLSVPWLLMCYGVFGGIGSALTNTNTFLITQNYLGKRRTIANTLASLGTSLSFVIMPLVVYALIKHLALPGAFLIWSSIVLHGLIGSMFYCFPKNLAKDTLSTSHPISESNSLVIKTQSENEQQSSNHICKEIEDKEVTILDDEKNEVMKKIPANCNDSISTQSEGDPQRNLEKCLKGITFAKNCNALDEQKFSESNQYTNHIFSKNTNDADFHGSDIKYSNENYFSDKNLKEVCQDNTYTKEDKYNVQNGSQLDIEVNDLTKSCKNVSYAECHTQTNRNSDEGSESGINISEWNNKANLVEYLDNGNEYLVHEEQEGMIKILINDHSLICAEDDIQTDVKNVTVDFKGNDNISVKSLPHDLECIHFNKDTYFDLRPELKTPDIFLSTYTMSLESLHTMKSMYISTENMFASLEYIDAMENITLSNESSQKEGSHKSEEQIIGFQNLPMNQNNETMIKAGRTSNFVLCGINFSRLNDFISLKPIRNYVFLAYCFSSIINKQVHLSFVIYLPMIAAAAGCKTAIPLLLGIIAIFELAAKFISSYVCLKKGFPLRFLHILISLTNSLFFIVLLFSVGFWTLASASAGLGIGMGILISTDPALLMEHFSPELLTHTYGLVLCVGGIFSVVMYPFQGWALDTTGTFQVLGTIMSLLALIPALLWSLTFLFCIQNETQKNIPK